MRLKTLLRRELLLRESEIRVAKNITIPDDIRKIQKVFKANGKALFVVGGAIRDALLGRKPKDWDLATDATPDEVILMLKPQQFITNIIETGKAFGEKIKELEINNFRASL